MENKDTMNKPIPTNTGGWANAKRYKAPANAILSDDIQLTECEENTRSGQEHAVKGADKGWSLDLCTQVREEPYGETSGLIANVSCRRTPGPITSTTPTRRKGSVSWKALKRRAESLYQQETLTTINRTNSGNVCFTAFNHINNTMKLSRGLPIMANRVYMQTVNSVERWNHTKATTMEDRGSVVPDNPTHNMAEETGKGAKSFPTSVGSAHSGSSHDKETSPNGERGNKRGSSFQTLEWIRQNKGLHPLNNLKKLLKDIDLWVAAYAKLAPNPGSLTPGGAGGNIDGTSIRTIKAIQLAVLEGRFKWGTTRRVNIPKPKGGSRPLGIPEFQDRIVQEVIRTILDAIYEPHFLDQSHGFRPKRSQHSGIKYIRAWFPGCTWYIEGDISKCFDTINHAKLMSILRRRIADRTFLQLIEKGLKCNVLLPSGQLEKTEFGVPQGGVVSPILSNIYLHELDKFLTRLKAKVDRGTRRRPNPEYQKYTGRIYRAAKAGNKEAVKAFTKKRRQLVSKDQLDPGYRRMVFVRYADDWLVGIIGPKELAQRIRRLVSKFLKQKLALNLNPDKTVITHNSERISFLSFLISTSKVSMNSKARLKGRTIKQRIPATYVRIYADIRKVINRLAEKGFCDKSGEAKPNWKLALQAPQSFSVARGAAIIRGLDNYYRVADDRRAFTHRIMRIIRSSLAKTFAAKFKLQTQAKVYAIAGSDLSSPIGRKTINKSPIGMTDETAKIHARSAGGDLLDKKIGIPYTKRGQIPPPDKSHSYTGNLNDATINDPLRTLNWSVLRARTQLEGICSKCGSSEKVEMHHVRALKDLKGKSPVEKLMISANRKQIPLCRPCHLQEHGKTHRISSHLP
jgi:group II intron reverse transcriptase/maturase